MIHPNQSFIDKFNTVNKMDDSIPTHLYGHKFKEKQRKEKFKNFVENKLQPKVISLNEEIKKMGECWIQCSTSSGYSIYSYKVIKNHF